MTLSGVHGALANSILMYMGIVSVWSIWRFIRNQRSDGSFLGALAIGELLIIVQVILGVVLWVTDSKPAGGAMHILYGIVGALGIPAIFMYARERSDRSEMVLSSAILLFMVGIFLRSIATGG